MNGEIGFSGTLEGFINTPGGGGEVPDIYADATVDNNTGTPSATVTKTVSPSGDAVTFHFAFQNLKGEQGQQGSQGIQGIPGERGVTGERGPRGYQGETGSQGIPGSDGYSPAVTITSITGGHRVTITDEDHPLGQSFDVMDGDNGNGISSAILNSDYTLTLNFTNGSSYTTPSIRGATGATGHGVPVGGLQGQVLAKRSDFDYEFEWVTSSSQMTYSTTPTQIGTWTDGKKVMLVVVNVNVQIASGWNNVLDMSTYNVYKILDAKFYTDNMNSRPYYSQYLEPTTKMLRGNFNTFVGDTISTVIVEYIEDDSE